MSPDTSVPVNPAVSETANRLARADAGTGERPSPAASPPDPAWKALRDLGTRLWLDTGDAEEAATLWNAEFEALTTNNTLLNREVQKGLYDRLVREAASEFRKAAPEMGEPQLLLEIAFVLNARHGLMLVERFGARVSVELHTDLADDIGRTVEYGRRFHAVCPERFIVKVPLSPAGLIGARRLSDEGIPVNFTLGFSARQNVLAALVARPSYVNVFMGRLSAFVVDNELGDGRNVGEKATLATQREVRALRETGKTESLLIGASMRDGSQVAALAGLDVYTMPPKVASQYRTAPEQKPVSRIADDPVVAPAPGVQLDDFAGGTLWDVPEAFRRCAAEIGALDPARLTAEDLVDRLAKAGFPDLFPPWSGPDIERVDADGKIPVYAHWKDRLASGRIGLDALMNLSAFRSFAADQAALDRRIRENLP